MKRNPTGFSLALVLTVGTMTGTRAGEAIPPPGLFSTAPVALSPYASPKPIVAGGSADSNDPNLSDVSLRFSGPAPESMTAAMERYRWMNERPVLEVPPSAPDRGGVYGWVRERILEPVFVPEVIQFHRVKVTGGLVKAIQRKNPFCLLNPLVFAADW